MKMIDHNHFICHLILGTFTEYPVLKKKRPDSDIILQSLNLVFFMSTGTGTIVTVTVPSAWLRSRQHPFPRATYRSGSCPVLSYVPPDN